VAPCGLSPIFLEMPLFMGELRSLGLKGRFASKESSKIAFVCQLYFVILQRTNPKSTT
jgi:hypothetical protein